MSVLDFHEPQTIDRLEAAPEILELGMFFDIAHRAIAFRKMVSFQTVYFFFAGGRMYFIPSRAMGTPIASEMKATTTGRTSSDSANRDGTVIDPITAIKTPAVSSPTPNRGGAAGLGSFSLCLFRLLIS